MSSTFQLMKWLHPDAEAPSSMRTRAWFWTRGVASTALVLFSTVLIAASIAAGHTAMSASFPVSAVAGALTLVLCLTMLALVEGLQVAIVELKLQSLESYRTSHPRALRLHTLLTKDQNVERFLIGRQIVVIFVVFAIALLTTLPGLSVWPGSSAPISPWFRVAFLASGMLGALLVVNVAQLMPQIVAAYDPVTFLDYRISYPTVQLTLALEWIGIAHCSWLLASAYVTAARALSRRTDAPTVQRSTTAVESLCQQLDSVDVALVHNEEGAAPIPKLLAGGKEYTSPAELAHEFSKNGLPVPSWMLPPDHPEHTPPHLVLMALLEEQRSVHDDGYAAAVPVADLAAFMKRALVTAYVSDESDGVSSEDEEEELPVSRPVDTIASADAVQVVVEA